ncbi:MAG: hypothetical protein ACXVNF_13190 [Neobacillus sp.]
MSYSITPTSNIVYTLINDQNSESGEEEFECSLDYVDCYKSGEPSYKNDDETWSYFFIAKTEHGNIKWEVQASLGMGGFFIEHSSIIECPENITIIEDARFEEA